MIVEAKRRGYFRVVVVQLLLITHILFVDDILVFCNGGRKDLKKLWVWLLMIKSPRYPYSILMHMRHKITTQSSF